jgi:hypothetical protein
VRLFTDSHFQFRDAQQFIFKAFIDPSLRDLRREVHHLRREFPKKAQKKLITTAVPPLQTSESILMQLLELLPSRAICDTLVTLYIQNTEKGYRILHIQTFLKECQQFWDARQSQSPFVPSAFLPQLVSVLATASSMDSAKELLNSEPSWSEVTVTKVLLLTEAWLCSLRGKRRLEMPFIQVYCLLVFAQLLCSPRRDEHEVWNATGALVRAAMTMGLHCNLPDSPVLPTFQNIMRRRLWAAIAEIDLQASLACGMPCMVPEGSLEHVLHLPNLNDSDLSEDMTEEPVSRPLDEYTDATIQVTLARSLPLRIRCMSNSFRNNSEPIHIQYTSALANSRELEYQMEQIPKAVRFIPHMVLKEQYLSDDSPVSLFHRIAVDAFFRRVLLFINRPFAMSESGNFGQSRRRALRDSLAVFAYLDCFTADVGDFSNGVRTVFNVILEDDIFRAAYNICMEMKLLGMDSFTTPEHLASISFVTGIGNQYSNNPLTDIRSYLADTIRKTLDSLNQRPDLLKRNIKDTFILSIILAFVKSEGSTEQKEAEARASVRELLKTILEKLRERKQKEESCEGEPRASIVRSNTESRKHMDESKHANWTHNDQAQEPPTPDQYAPPSFRAGRRQSRRVLDAAPVASPSTQEGFMVQFDDTPNYGFDPTIPITESHQVRTIRLMKSRTLFLNVIVFSVLMYEYFRQHLIGTIWT